MKNEISFFVGQTALKKAGCIADLDLDKLVVCLNPVFNGNSCRITYNESADIHTLEKSCFYNFAATKQASIAGYVDEPTSDFIMSL